MKKFLFFFLLILPVYLFLTFYYLDKYYFSYPIAYKGGIAIRSDARGDGFFGAQRNGRRIHEGIDLLAEVGTPILAVRCGVVVSAKENRGMGKYVIIQHGPGLTTVYGHLSKILVHKNQFVRQGEIIGRVGKTGNANFRDIQPHLHFEVRQNGRPQDPLEYLGQ